MMSYKLIINSKHQRQEFSGISSEECDRFIKQVKTYAAGAIALTIDAQQETVLAAIAQFEKMKEGDFYLTQEGYKVFTEQYHLKRGYCCQSNCRH